MDANTNGQTDDLLQKVREKSPQLAAEIVDIRDAHRKQVLVDMVEQKRRGELCDVRVWRELDILNFEWKFYEPELAQYANVELVLKECPLDLSVEPTVAKGYKIISGTSVRIQCQEGDVYHITLIFHIENNKHRNNKSGVQVSTCVIGIPLSPEKKQFLEGFGDKGEPLRQTAQGCIEKDDAFDEAVSAYVNAINAKDLPLKERKRRIEQFKAEMEMMRQG